MLNAIAAANIAFCTLCMARPSSVAGIRWVQSSGMSPVIVDGDHLALDARLQHHAAPAFLDVLAHQLVSGSMVT